MPIHRLLTAAAALALLTGLSTQVQAQAPAAPAMAPAAPAPMAMPTAKLAPNGDTTATLRQSPDFTTFVKALDTVNLAGMLQTRPGMTVFAPTNAAFAALPPGQLDALMADKTALQKLLLHHIINAKVDTTKIKGTRGPWPSGAGDKIVLDGSTDGVIKADNATITQPDVTTPNGTIQVVDNVLIAGSVPLVLAEPAPPPEAAPPPPAPAKVVTKTKTVTKKKK